MSATARIIDGGVAASIYVEDVTTALLTYNQIRLYRATSPDGTFSTTGDVASLVAAQELYAITDSSGDANKYYQYDLYHTVSTAASAKSEVFAPSEATLLKVRLEAARQAGAGFASTCSALGTTTTLIDDKLKDEGVSTDFLEGAWIYRPDAAAAGDKLRRVKAAGFATSTGTLSIDRAWTNAPASAEVYHIYTLLPPVLSAGQAYSWDRAVQDALAETWYVDLLNVGPGTTVPTVRFDLAPFPIQRDSVRRVFTRYVDDNDEIHDTDQSLLGKYWKVEENAGGLTLVLSTAPTTSESVFVEANRTYAPLYTDAAVTPCPFALAWRGAVWKAYEHLNRVQTGKYAIEVQGARTDFLNEYARHRPQNMVLT